MGRRRKVLVHLRRVVGGVLDVLVQWRRPRGLLWFGIERYGADEVSDRCQHLPRHCADRPVRRQCDVVRSTVAVLSHGMMVMQIQRDDQGAGTIWGGQRKGLPAAPAQAQRSVLKLRLGRRQRCGELAEHLSVCVKGVACCGPCLVREREPSCRHCGHPRKGYWRLASKTFIRNLPGL